MSQQTFYIESDEEIISVIGRLRTSSAEENYFVFPKRALVLQSIVNLRLFQREAQKIGKKIVIVTQDEIGRMLAEKAGIRTEHYSEDFSQRGTHLELAPSEPKGNTAIRQAAEIVAPAAKQEHTVPHADTIGSSDFYAPQATVSASVIGSPAEQIPEKESRKLRIRNASPERPPSLNSMRLPEKTEKPERSAPGMAPAPDREERLKNFFSGSIAPVKPVAAPATPQKSSRTPYHIPVVGKKAQPIFLFLGGISLLSLLGVALFLFLPKAEIHVTPHKTTQSADLQFNGRSGGDMNGENVISVRLAEREETVSFSMETTGKAGGSNQKARGTAVIYNEYSSDPQPLVATTRLETSDGRLFRLVEGVTVPGMTDVGGRKEPGAIEANVIADQAGAEYNIGSATFTIPGFKGGPKYGKFSAKSAKAFSGGGDGGSDISVIAKIDMENAEKQAREKAKEAFLNEIRSGLSEDEKVLEEELEIIPGGTTTLPQAGTAATAFDYRNTFKIRAFIFSEKKIREAFEAASRTELQGISFRPVSITLEYGESLPNYSEGTVRLKAHALIALESVIDQEKLREAILGQDAEGIEQTLESFPSIKKIEVNFDPRFISSVPKSKDRVMILVEPGEE